MAGEDVFSANYLGKETRKAVLLTKLNELHKALKGLSQDPADRPEGLQRTAAQLISNKILGNPDKDLRLMASCCIVDVFRLFAPDSPYSDDENVAVFKVIIAQLRGLSMHDPGAGTGNKIMYILTSLATVKTCVVPVILAQNGIAGAEELVKSLFEALVSSVRPEHGEDVISVMSSVLQSCIDESEEVDQELLDTLLSPLLPAAKADNPAAYALVSGALRRVTGNIQSNISSFVNHVLVGTSPHNGDNKDAATSELSDHIYPLIYELHKISPGLLLRVLPNVCEQLKAEEEDVRLRAVKLLGRLFASPSAEYGTEFARNFREFLGRFVDLSAAVRLEMVDQCALVMKRKPNLRTAVEEHIVRRLRDAEMDIRQAALVKLLEMGLEDPLSLSVATFGDIADRAKDKKEAINSRAIRGLAQMYSKFVSSALPPLAKLTEGSSVQSPQDFVRKEVLERLSLVPGTIVDYWGYPDLKLRHLVVHSLQEALLPKLKHVSATAGASQSQSSVVRGGAVGKKGKGAVKGGKGGSKAVGNSDSPMEDGDDDDEDGSSETPNGSRATALVLMFSLLDDAQQNKKLGTILGFKSRVAGDLRLFLSSRQSLLAAGAKPSAAEQVALKSSMMRLYKSVPIVDKKVQPLEKLHAMKDKTIVKLLTHAVSPSDTISEGAASREDLKQRLDSKSQTSEYISIVYDFAASFVSNQGMLSELLQYAAAASPAEAHETARLICLLAKHSPGIFSDSAGAFEDWVSSLADVCTGKQHSSTSSSPRSVMMACLHAIELASVGVAEGDEESCLNLCRSLLGLAQDLNEAELCEAMARTASLLAHHVATSPANQGNKNYKADQVTVTAVSGLVKGLAQSGSSSGGGKMLQRDLLVLSALLRVPSRLDSTAKQAFAATVKATRKVRAPLLEYLTNELFVGDNIGAKKVDKDSEPSQRPQSLVAGLKAWAALLSAEEELGGSAHGDRMAVDASSEEAGDYIKGVSREMNELLDVLFECIEKVGAVLCGCKVGNTATAAKLYAAAAGEAMGLIKIKAIGDGLSVARWKKLAWTLLDGNGEVRMQLADLLLDILPIHAVHVRFLAYPCLLLSSSTNAEAQYLNERAQRVLLFVMRRLRTTQEILTQRALADEDEEAQLKAQNSMPELAMPYLLYLLSYHPDFPQAMDLPDEEDQRRTRHMITTLRTFLKVLAESLPGDESNLSFLLKQVSIVSFHDDASDESNLGLDFVTVLASKLLNELVKSDEHAVEYHGDIALPSELFKHKPSVQPGRRAKPGGAVATGSAADNIESSAMDRVLNAVKEKKTGGGGGGGGAKAKAGAPANARKRAASDLDDAAAGAGAGGGKKSKAANKKAKTSRVSPKGAKSKHDDDDDGAAAQRQQDRPRRAVSKAVSYREHDENDKETSMWDEAAGTRRDSGASTSASASASATATLGKAVKSVAAGKAVQDDDSSDMDAAADSDDDDDDDEDERMRGGKPLASSRLANASSDDSQPVDSSSGPAATKPAAKGKDKGPAAAAKPKAKAAPGKTTKAGKGPKPATDAGQQKLTAFIKKPLR